MLQELRLLVLHTAETLQSFFCDFAANQCVTITCVITATVNRKEQSTVFHVFFSYLMERTLFLGTLV